MVDRRQPEQQFYGTGEFARLTAVSVRTLRFYDQIGLLVPSGRTEAGYRRYSTADLLRLQQILVLKFLGFGLDEIKHVLNVPLASLQPALAQQRAMLEERRRQLEIVIQSVDQAERMVCRDGSDWAALLQVIQAIQMNQSNDWRNRYLTAEQLKTLQAMSDTAYTDEARAALAARPPWTEADQQRVDEQYAALYAGVRQAVAAGEEPAGPTGQALAGQAIGLIEAFTGGEAVVTEGLKTFWANFQALPADQRPFQIPLNETEAAFLEEAKSIFVDRRQSETGAN